VDRGKGIHQPSMNDAIELLNKKKWVHIFPEGIHANQAESISLDNYCASSGE
jgi:hypothetical protein